MCLPIWGQVNGDKWGSKLGLSVRNPFWGRLKTRLCVYFDTLFGNRLVFKHLQGHDGFPPPQACDNASDTPKMGFPASWEGFQAGTGTIGLPDRSVAGIARQRDLWGIGETT
jgi:hypothetical protein